IVWPGRRQPLGVARPTSSNTPSTPTTGVGWMAVVPVWLYIDTLPPVTGMPKSTQADDRPSTVWANCHMISGAAGEPKFRQSVTARGRAPEVATLRWASDSASLAP